MRRDKTIHLLILGVAACTAWLAAAPAARATMIVRHVPYEEITAMAPYWPVAWQAIKAPILITDEAAGTGTAATAKLNSLASMLPMEDLPTSAVPEPATAGFLLLGAASLWFLKFRRNRQV